MPKGISRIIGDRQAGAAEKPAAPPRRNAAQAAVAVHAHRACSAIEVEITVSQLPAAG
ncbi:hypothetical protein [Mesorhizobium sp. B2-1-3A]|uniref:hypothetical protein n=1 Tax=Mesorhizobium sp. B2-1-3A TaxID=2589971 RepID=UPI0015E398FC|nr:hypothetical protein [Mesorhizobium sp. B2-1-3A]